MRSSAARLLTYGTTDRLIYPPPARHPPCPNQVAKAQGGAHQEQDAQKAAQGPRSTVARVYIERETRVIRSSRLGTRTDRAPALESSILNYCSTSFSHKSGSTSALWDSLLALPNMGRCSPPVASRSARRHCGQWSLEWPFWPHAKQRPRKGRVPAAAGARTRSRPATTALPHAAPRTNPAWCAPRSAPSGGGGASASPVHATRHAPCAAGVAASGVSGTALAPGTSPPAAHGGAARTLRPERW